MARQPFRSKFPGASVNFGPEPLKRRPKAALLIAQCITGWTEIEVRTTTMLARMLRVNVESVIALYFTLADERAKHEALCSIAEFVFNDDDKLLFDRIMSIRSSVSKERNDLAHGLFGSTPLDDDGVAWISTQDRIKHILDIDRLLASSPVEMGKHVHFDLRDIASFYTIEDLQLVLDDIASLHRITAMFADLIDVNAPIGQANYLRPKLLNEPLVLKSLSPMDTNQKNDP
jgi:hypothetical protein